MSSTLSRARRSVFAAALALALATVVTARPAEAQSELFFSEYIEGTSNNKALEIANGTGAAVDLAAGGYNVQMFFNGNPVAGLTINLTGTVMDGDVFVLAQSSASAAILAQADQTNAAGWFNGDDAVALRKGTTIIDVIGQIGFDPGTEWGSGLASTMDNTLRRKSNVRMGDTNGSDAFDPAVQWDGFATDTFDGLGHHTIDPGDLPPTTASTNPPQGAIDVALDANVGVTFSEPVNVIGDWFSVLCSISGPHTAAVSGGPQTFTLDPDADFAVNESCTVTVFAAQVSDQDTDDPPDNMAANFTWSFTTVLPARPIYEIQGDGLTSPFVGTVQKTFGVVTVILGNGFFIQDPAGDGDPDTSDGIFVFGTSEARLRAPGDEVTVTGTVVEFRAATRPRDLTLTELSSATVVKTGEGAPLPAPVVIADRPDTAIHPDGSAAFEALEGMRVEIPGARVVGPTNTFGELLVVAAADVANMAPRGNAIVRSLGGDHVDYNPERIMVDDEARQPGGTGSGVRITNPQVPVKVGDAASGPIVGAMDYQFSNYRVQASHPMTAVFASTTASSPVANLRPAQPFEGRVATFNVLNLFDCVDAPGKADDHPTCNAATRNALERQLAKLAMAFEQELGSPQIVIVEETENSDVLNGDASGFVPGTSIPALLPRLSGNYHAVSFDASDERGIEVAFVYDTDRVTLHDAFLATTVLPDAAGVFDGSVFRAGREPLVGVFTLDGLDLVVVGNHLKSKGGPQFGLADEAGDDPLYGAFQPPTRWTEQIRHQQADYVRALVDLLIANYPGAGILVGGDLNDFAFPEPGEGQDTVARIKDSTTNPLTNVIDRMPEAERYTFMFEGNSQVLDHMLLSADLAARLRDQGIAHFNADYPASFASDPAVTLRASDHDPVVTYLCTDTAAPSLAVSVSPETLWPANHRYVTVRAVVSASDDADPAPVVELVSVTSNEPDNGRGDGNTRQDVVIVDDFTFQLRAERSGLGDGRIYTITYRVTDACGNSVLATATVTVPHSQRR